MITPFVLLLHFYPPSHDKTSPALSLIVSMPEALHRTHKETSHLGTLKNCDHFVSIVVRQVFSFFIQNCFWFFRSYQFLLSVSLLVWLTRDQPSVSKRVWMEEPNYSFCSARVTFFVPYICKWKKTSSNSFGYFLKRDQKNRFFVKITFFFFGIKWSSFLTHSPNPPTQMKKQ